MAGYAQEVFSGSPLSFEAPGNLHTQTVVEYDRDPIVKPCEDFCLKITLKNLRRDSRYYTIVPYLPEGWTADYNKTAHCRYVQRPHQEDGLGYVEMTIHVGESVEAVNSFPIMLHDTQHALPITIPVVLLG